MQYYINIATAIGSRTLALLLVLCVSTGYMSAQCENWKESSDKEKAENAHVAYRNFVKSSDDFTTLSDEEFESAFKNWKIAYDIAPAADGGRPFHFTDGREFYRALAAKATDDSKKKEHLDRLFELYDEEKVCYPGAKGYLTTRKGYDMFYLQGYSAEAIDVLEQGMTEGGNESEYIFLAPLGQLLGYFFKTEQIEKARVRELYDQASKIADFNIEKGGDYVTYWEAGKANLDASVLEYADQIFDCAYFKADLMPSFEENKENLEVMRYIVKKLKEQGCPDNDEDIARVQAQYDAIYATKSAEQEAIRRQNNPLYDASLMVDDGDYTGAIKRYKDAIDGGDDNEKKAQAYYQIASLQLGKLKQYGAARQNANKAAALNPGWGKPIMMIGDIYARLGSSCGDAYQQRLAVLAAIDKYNYAKRIDGSIAGDVNRRIANYRGSMPIKADAFSRGQSAGDKIKVGCGIGETVTLRF